MDIKKYIGETTEYDKKREVEHRKVKSWLKSVSAFANGVGGCLLLAWRTTTPSWDLLMPRPMRSLSVRR